MRLSPATAPAAESFPGSFFDSFRADLRFVTLTGTLSLLLPLLHLVVLAELPTFSVPIIDSIEYIDLARQMIGTLPSDGTPYLHSPFYAWVLAAAFRAGLDLLGIRIVQSVLNAASCLLIYAIALRCFSRPVARIAALAWTIYGPIVFYSVEILSVPWVLFLNLASLHLILIAGERRSLTRWLFAGLVTGIAATARADILLFAAVMGMVILAIGDGRFVLRLRARCVPFAAGVVAPLVFVAVCNEARSGRFLPLPINSGLNFYIGNNPNYRATMGIRPGVTFDDLMNMPVRDGLGRAGNEPEHSRYFYAKALDFVRTDFAGYIGCQLYKVRALVSSYELPETLDIYTTAQHGGILRWLTWRWGTFGFPFGLLLPFAALGGWLAREELRRRPAVIAMLGCFAVSLLIYWPSARYRMSLIPLLLVLAAVALDVLVRDRKRFWGRPALGGVACFALAAVAANLPFSHFSQRYNFESESYYLAGRGLIDHGQTQRGQRWIEKAIALDPTNGQAHNSLGVTLAKQERWEEAALHFREALRLQPGDVSASTNLARVLERLPATR